MKYMEEQYKIFLSTLKSSETYFKAIKKLEHKFKIENIFSITQEELSKKFDKKTISSLSKNEKSYLNKFVEFKNFSIETSKAIEKNRIELEAIVFAREHFENKSYIVTNVEKENIGYDLIAEGKDERLTLEVKGISGNRKSFILSSNENKYFDQNLKNHRICLVQNCEKTKKNISVFKFYEKSKNWQDDDNNILRFDKFLSAQYKIIKE